MHARFATDIAITESLAWPLNCSLIPIAHFLSIRTSSAPPIKHTAANQRQVDGVAPWQDAYLPTFGAKTAKLPKIPFPLRFKPETQLKKLG